MAWMRFTPDSPEPSITKTWKGSRFESKSEVYSLGPVGPDGVEVVAKELLRQAADVELTVYRDVLSRLSVRGPRLLGWIDSDRPESRWLFLERVGGTPFDKTNHAHVAQATRYLAALHCEAITEPVTATLPDRSAGFYESLLHTTTADLDRVTPNPALTGADRTLLSSIASLLQTLAATWDSVAGVLDACPVTLVHGDFKATNMAFADRGGQDLRVFDWSEANRGAAAIDLWAADVAGYHEALDEYGPTPPIDEIAGWAEVGSLIRTVLSIAWEVSRLQFAFVERPMRRMALYESRLRTAMEDPRWRG